MDMGDDIMKLLEKFANSAILECEINKYFRWADENNKPYSIARLASHLGVSRATIYNYEEKKFFGPVITAARDRILASLEEKLLEHGTSGQIFLAKNYGYSDRQEIVSNNVNTNGIDENTKDTLNKLLEKLGK